MAEVLVVELKNQPAGPPTVWLAYDVVRGVCAEAVTAIRSTVMTRFVTVAVAIVAAAMWPSFFFGAQIKIGFENEFKYKKSDMGDVGRGCNASLPPGCRTRGVVV